MKHIIILTILFSSLFIGAKGQSNQEKAKNYYHTAKKAFKEKDLKKCLLYLEEITDLLGATNIKVQSLKIKALYGLKDYDGVVRELPNYTKLNPDVNWAEYEAIMSIVTDSKSKQKEELSTYKQIVKLPTIRTCSNFLSNFPKSRYNKEITALKYDLEENRDWDIAKLAKSTSAYYKYLDAYPNGKYTQEAKRTIATWDKAAFDKAVAKHTVYGYSYYLSTYTRGLYRTEISKKKALLEEDNLYNSVENGTITQLKSYLNKYLNGRYFTKVKDQLHQRYRADIEQSFQAANYSACKELCIDYQNYLESNTYNQKMLEKTNSKLKAQARKSKRDSYPTHLLVDYTWTENSMMGLTVGSLPNKKIGMYLSFKASNGKTEEGNYHSIDFDDPKDVNEYGDLDRLYINNGITVGLTKKIFRPLWLMAGVGGGWSAENVIDTDGEYVLILGTEKVDVIYEYGAIISVKFINIGAKRVKYPYGWENLFSVGLSINL